MQKVLITDYLTEAGVESLVLGTTADIQVLQATAEDQLTDHVRNADALLVFHDISISEATIEQLVQCRIIVRCGVGFDNIDRAAAGKRGIVVCNVPDYGTEEVADHAMLLLLALTRRLVPCHQAIVEGGWDPELAFATPRLRGKTIGLIGCGRIGTATALRAKAFGLRVLFYDPYVPRGLDKALGITRHDRLDAMLPAVDFLSLHCPLTSETHHIVNKETLSQIKREAVVINTARGGCIDLDALADALDSGQIAGAGLDVVESEPLSHARIRTHPRVLLTPHVAYYSIEGLREMRTKAAQEVQRALHDIPVHNPVNLPWLTTPRCKVSQPKL